MNNYKIVNLANGVEGGFIKDDKFKSSLLTFSFFVPLNEKAAEFSILSKILTNTNAEFPTMRDLKKRLYELYNADLSCKIVKKDDMLRIEFEAIFLNDDYTLNGEIISVEVADLVLKSLFNPSKVDGKFVDLDIERERRLLVDAVNAEINNKRLYAINKAIALMCDNEPFALPKYGTVEQLNFVSNEKLQSAHDYILHNAFLRVNYIGKEYPDSLFKLIADKFSSFDRSNVIKKLDCTPHKPSSEIKNKIDEIDVNQSKLFMGFSFDCDYEFENEMVAKYFILLYSAATFSKCFRYVREKLSLCYYCSPTLIFDKKMFFVDCGIDAVNYEKAVDAIKLQLDSMKNGEISDEDFDAATLILKSDLKEITDSQDAMNNFLVSNIFVDEKYNDISLREKVITSVTKKQVIDFAQSVKLDTIYMLKGTTEGVEVDG